MRVLVKVLLAGAAALACAVEAPPPGGAIDDIPPEVTGTVPTSDSAGVDPGTAIIISFSEDMTRTGLERLFNTRPEIEIGTVDWNGRSVVIQPLDSLHPDTTYIATLSAGFRDNHKVPSKEDYWWAFATSAAVDSGTISGTVYFRREPTANGVARCFFLPLDSAFVPRASRPDREARADDTGNYWLRYLPTQFKRFVVWAFEDKNSNGQFDPEGEYGDAFPDTVLLTPEAPFESAVDIAIVDPTEPGSLAGVVVNRSGIDTIAVTVTLSPDTALAPAYLAVPDTTGAFAFPKVAMGRYVLRAFVDVAPDSVCGEFPCFDDTTRLCLEPCTVAPDTVSITPGDQLQADTLYLDPTETPEGVRR